MYAILSGGALLALCDKPRYVRLNPDSGAYVEAAPEEAIAISVNGDLYNINGGSAIPDAPLAAACAKSSRPKDGSSSARLPRTSRVSRATASRSYFGQLFSSAKAHKKPQAFSPSGIPRTAAR